MEWMRDLLPFSPEPDYIDWVHYSNIYKFLGMCMCSQSNEQITQKRWWNEPSNKFENKVGRMLNPNLHCTLLSQKTQAWWTSLSEKLPNGISLVDPCLE